MPLNQWSDTILIAELSDEPAFSEDMDALMRRMESMQSDVPDLVIDLKRVTYLNSSNIAQLLRVRKRVAETGRRMRICSVPDTVWSVLLITGLDQIFEFTDDVTTSLASLQIAE